MRRHLPLRKKLLASLIRTAVVATALGPTISWAQSADATLRGKAPAKATVTAKNIETGAVRRTTASEDGSYALVGLPPGAYTVDAGAGTRTERDAVGCVDADLGSHGGTDCTVDNDDHAEGVSVTATTLQEVKTSEIGTEVSQRQIETVPQITRNFLEFADTVPGMVFSVDPEGNTSLQGGGISTSGINVYIDGVGQKNYVLPSGLTGQTGSQGNPFPQLAIGEYKVITSNYKAEYDQISSAAMTAETKSGTNEFHGDVFGDYTDSDLRSKTPAETAASKKTDSQQKEYGFDIGGPIIKDTMHFFLAYEAKKFDTPVAVVPGGTVGIADELPQSAKDADRSGQLAVQRRFLVRQDRLGIVRPRPDRTVRQVSRRNRDQRRERRGCADRPRSTRSTPISATTCVGSTARTHGSTNCCSRTRMRSTTRRR